MSYILEALKQSEGRRKEDAPPDPSPAAPAFATRRSRRRSGRWPLAVALMGAIVLLGWLVLDRTDSPAATTAIAANDSGTDQGVAPADGAPSAVDAPGEAPVAPSVGVAEMIVEAIGNDELKGVRIQLEAPTAPRTQPVQQGAEQAAVPTRSPENDSAADRAHRVEQPQPEARTDAHAGLPFRRQLPVDVQRSLPELVFSVHIYSADPASRRVKIGERMMREGQRITPQLRLEEIIPKGVILSYEDYRFRMNAL
ncbi:general secretion pathway protein GspB [Marinobacterium rhizophilum]|uniref:General secretion pathway protein GspB n=1 Tax=Marinobacterium rhizophilum TaxID=420402 RepID=A0ABY5HLQ5_9GAMM|nr:general secretion pathway protein GspB [Marinobacterium rhizophilum]UTW12199.1 general secretion pathway protein GspB [Marinobacterium rhizophilum]